MVATGEPTSSRLPTNPTVVAAVVAGVFGLIGSIITLIGTLATASAGEGTQTPCLTIITGYQEKLRQNPGLIDILLAPSSGGGRSLFASDEDARRCGLDEAALRRLAG
jgi:hypothetical protein